MNALYIAANIGILGYSAYLLIESVRTMFEIRLVNRAIKLLNRMQSFKVTPDNLDTFKQVMSYLEAPHTRLALNLAEELITQEENR